MSNQQAYAQGAAQGDRNTLGSSRRRSTARVALTPIVVGFVVGMAFVAIFLAAGSAAQPRHLPVGIVGTAEEVRAIDQEAGSRGSDVLALTPYRSEADARDAVERRAVYGAYVASGESRTALLLYGSANGPAVLNTLQAVLTPLTEASGVTLASEDIVVASPIDTRGTAVFYTAFGIVLAAYLFGITQYQMVPKMRARWRLVNLIGFSILSGTAVSLTAGATGFDAIPGDVPALTVATIMLAMAVGSATQFLMRIGGPIGTLLASSILLVLGNATSGGVLPAEYIPEALQPFSHALPVGLAVRALIGTAYFGGDGYAIGLILLTAWSVCSIAAVVILDRIVGRTITRSDQENNHAAR